MNETNPARPVRPGTGRKTQAPPVIDSQALFGGHRRLLIQHAGSFYQLQITRQGKLILTR